MKDQTLRAHDYAKPQPKADAAPALPNPKIVPIRQVNVEQWLSSFYREPVAKIVWANGATRHIRASVADFAQLMNDKLDERTEKRGGGREQWMRRQFEEHLRDLKGELAELEAALRSRDCDEIQREAADVANYAMFLADRTRRKPQ